LSADFARYIGIPYLSRGRDWSGVDCWGLYRLMVGEATGVWLPDYLEAYGEADNEVEVAEAILALGTGCPDWVQTYDPQPLDAVAIRIAGHICHIGCYIGGGRMIHSLRGHDSVCEATGGAKWAKRVIGFWHPPLGL